MNRPPFPPLCRALAAVLALVALSPAAARGQDYFREATAEAGLDFIHFNGMSGELYYPEMMGGGVALLDYDLDGDLDVYLVQGAMIGEGKTPADALVPYAGPPGPPRDRLLRNDLAAGPDGRVGVRFTDVTDEAGLDARGYGMGVAVGDVDGDGDPDLYLAQYGANQLWRNNGDGTFSEAASAAGVEVPEWSVAASFFDLEGDGDVDLYVANYVVYRVEKNVRCFANSSRRDYCGPAAFTGEADRLFVNRGDGTFTDASASSGVGRAREPGMGVVARDFTGDGRPDLFVTNDGRPNLLWVNQGDGTFVDEALLAGTALNREGSPEASMGIAAGDPDQDGDEDIFITHLAAETNTYYRNEGGGLFEDRTIQTNLSAGSLPFTSFGAAWLDVDGDGRLDLAVASGAVKIQEEQAQEGDIYPLDQPNQLFRGSDAGRSAGERFEDVSVRGGPAFTEAEVSRGLVAGDLDGDGDDDLLLTNNAGPARLLLGTVDPPGADRPDDAGWVGVAWRGPEAANGGGRATLALAGGGRVERLAATDGSYASATETRLRLTAPRGEGGRRPAALSLLVRHPDGTAVLLKKPPQGSYLVWGAR